MKALVVLTFDIADPEEVAGILTAIDPPKLPKFAGQARVTVGMPAQRVLEYLEGEGDGSPIGAPVAEHASAYAQLERLARDFDHYANHGDPAEGADVFYRMLHAHISALALYAGGHAPLQHVVDLLERPDRALVADGIREGLTSPVGQSRVPRPPAKPGASFGPGATR